MFRPEPLLRRIDQKHSFDSSFTVKRTETIRGQIGERLSFLRLAHLSTSAIVLNSYNKYRAPTKNRLRDDEKGICPWRRTALPSEYVLSISNLQVLHTRTNRIRRWEYPFLGVLK